MKNNLSDILSNADTRELDILLENIDETPLDNSTVHEIKAKTKNKIKHRRLGILMNFSRKSVASFVALLIGASVICFGGYAYAADVRQYNDAVSFFEDHNLSSEGLSRSEIKAIYRDITTETFKYPKTAEVIVRSISGYELSETDPTPEDIEALWNYKNYNGRYWVSKENTGNTVKYRYYGEDKMDEQLGFLVFDRSYFEKYENDSLIWSVSFEDFYIEGYSKFENGNVVYGHSARISSEQDLYSYMSFVTDGGEVLWTLKLDNGFHTEYICSIVDNGDGTMAVFSRGDLGVFCLGQYDKEGNRKSFGKTEIGNYGIWNAVRFEDGYIVQLGSYNTGEMAKIVKADKNGNITESFSYTSEDYYYYITDMIEFGGNIYLSAYAVPKGEDDEHAKTGHYEISSIIEEIIDNRNFKISSEELTKKVRDNYTAMLLVCDSSVGTPMEFYSVNGAVGGELSLDENGNLLWDVENIATVSYSPMTSAYSFKGASYIYRYTFDRNGLLISHVKTGEITDFIR